MAFVSPFSATFFSKSQKEGKRPYAPTIKPCGFLKITHTYQHTVIDSLPWLTITSTGVHASGCVRYE
jgi:hypothetical protein